MRLLFLLFAIGISIARNAGAQGLSPDERRIVETARSRYYSLDGHGFVSVTCSVKFDFSTVPILLSADSAGDLRQIEATKFTLTLDRNGPTVQHEFPDATDEGTRRRADPTVNLLSSLVQGLFLTWPTKGLNGPIPMFDSQIKSAVETSDGYRLVLSFPGDPVRIEMNKDYLVTEIVSVGGKVDERPEYRSSPEGLVFSGNAAVDNSESSGPVNVTYKMENSVIDGFRLPTAVHLQVHPNIDVTFALDGCSVSRGTVISAQPPNATSK